MEAQKLGIEETLLGLDGRVLDVTGAYDETEYLNCLNIWGSSVQFLLFL